jgi:Carboxypeptidase regulatory-like domain
MRKSALCALGGEVLSDLSFDQIKLVRVFGRAAIIKLLVLTVFVCFPLLFVKAQTTAQVAGTVSDASGAAVPDAQVQITDTDTNAVRTVETAGDGTYDFPNLPIGPYRLEVSKQGFTKYVQAGIVLQVNTNPTVNITLQVGAVTQTVEVQANAAMVETQSTGVGQVIQPEQVVDLPLNGRQVTQLIALSGAAVNTTLPPSNGGSLDSTLDYPGSVSISIAGNEPNATNYTLDGSVNVDYRTNTGAPLPFPDALEEFRVNTSTVPANEGTRPGGTVTAITKPGTNTLHGDLFEFLRNGHVNADTRTFPTVSGIPVAGIPDNLKRNQYGGTIGGPIKRDKLFFFYGIQQTAVRQNLAPTVTTLPTPLTLAGNFTEFNSPACNGNVQKELATVIPAEGSIPAQRLLALDGSGNPIPNVIDPSWLNTPAAKMNAVLATYLPTPSDTVCGQFTYSQYQANNETQQIGRIDWQRTSKDTIFGRYFIGKFSQPSTYDPNSPNKLLTMTVVQLADLDQNAALGDTHIISAAMVSTFRVFFGRTGANRSSDPRIPTLCTIGQAFNANFTCMNPASQIDDFTANAPGNTGYTYQNSIGISENIGWQFGSHHLEMGFAGQRVEMNAWGTFNTNPLPSYSVGTVATSSVASGTNPACAPLAVSSCNVVTTANSWTGVALGDFVTGNVSSFSQGHGQLSRIHEYLPGTYAQDNWRLNRSLQLNLGLRWDPFLPPVSTYGYNGNFSLIGFEENKISSVYPNAPPGITFPGDPGFNGKSGVQSRLGEFSPRIGVVFDPTGQGKMTLRGGYGYFQDASVLWYSNDISQDPPWGNTHSITLPLPVNLANPSQGGGITNVWFGTTGNPFPEPINPGPSFQFPVPTVINGVATSTGVNYEYLANNIKPPRIQEWSASFQWQMKPNWLFSASYMGNSTSNIWETVTQNPDVIVLPTMTSAQYPAIVNVSSVSANGATGACTLTFGGTPVTLSTCNSTSSSSVTARRLLSMLSPGPRGGGMLGSGGVTLAEPVGLGTYNGLLVSVQHRLSQGFSILGNYTYGRCLNTTTINQDLSGVGQNPFNPRGEYANCDYDHRHIVNLSLVGEMPKFASASKERIIGNWNASGIFTASTGSPFTATSTNSNYSLNGYGSDRPNVYGNPFVGGPVLANPTLTAAQQATCPTVVHTWTNWFNPCAYGNNPVIGQLGNEGRNSLYGPGAWDFDMAIWRSFPIRERFHLDFRAEAFNLLNHPVLGAPTSALSSSTPGRITSVLSTTNPRQLQAAVKLSF